MNGERLLTRLARGVLTVYLVTSLAFGVVAFTEDPNVLEVRYAAAAGGADAAEQDAAVEAYRQANNLDEPIADRYVRWMVDVTTLDWGVSKSRGAPVTELIRNRLPYTLGYLVPGLAVSFLLGLVGGVYTAFRRGGVVDRLGSSLMGLTLGVPNFWLGTVLLVFLGTAFGWDATGFDLTAPFVTEKNLRRYLLPTAVLAVGMTASQWRYTRSKSVQLLGEPFVRLVRAKGASERRVARHVLANAAAPLATLFFADLLAVLVVNVYVIEFVFDIPGFGQLSYFAVKDRDLPLIVGTTLVVVAVGVAGGLLQDVVESVADPRVGDERP